MVGSWRRRALAVVKLLLGAFFATTYRSHREIVNIYAQTAKLLVLFQAIQDFCGMQWQIPQ